MLQGAVLPRGAGGALRGVRSAGAALAGFLSSWQRQEGERAVSGAAAPKGACSPPRLCCLGLAETDLGKEGISGW